MHDKDPWAVVKETTGGRVRWALQVSKGKTILHTIRLEPDVTYIGRMPENHVILDDEKISRSHARIFREGERFILEDQKSQNGTFVNEKKIERHPLALGDKIRVGDHILYVVPATARDKGAVREEHLEQAEEEEWRMDETISMPVMDAQKLLEKKAAEGRRAGPPKSPVQPPTFSYHLKVGPNVYTKEIVFRKGRKRGAGDPPGDELTVRITVGPWILEEKVPL